MGNVYINGMVVGIFEPQYLDTSGDIYLNGSDVGTFNLATETGNVLLNSDVIGSYVVLSPPVTGIGWIQPVQIKPIQLKPEMIL